MKIHCDVRFLDGRDVYEKGDIRVVSDERGVYFVGNGWAHDVTPGDAYATTAENSATGETSLDVQNVTQTQEVKYG